MTNLSLSIVEVAVLFACAVMVGITIHFFIVSRRNFKTSPIETDKISKSLEDWKRRYFNDIEAKEKELVEWRKRAEDSEENSHIYAVEAEEMRKQSKRLQSELESLRHSALPGEKPDYIDQLREAQTSLMEHHGKINLLLEQIDIVRETESRQQEIQKYNEELSGQVDDLKQMLSQKEKEIDNIRQKAHLTREMNSMLDNAYSEFNVLQDKIKKLEGQVNASKRMNMEFEDLKEGHFKISREYEELKVKYNAAYSENQQLHAELSETEEKLREANFQRQQLQKRVAYLEELNNDMQAVADANKKLEGQLRRIGELESMLNVVAEERDELVRKQNKAS